MIVRRVAGAVVALAVVGAGAFLVQRVQFSGGEDSGPEPQRLGESSLQGVEVSDLAEDGINLSQPPKDYLAPLSGSNAKEAVRGVYSDVSARQIVLAHLETENVGGFAGEVWIINYDLNDDDIMKECRNSAMLFALSFVDANNGRVLFSTSRERPSLSSPGCGGPAGRPAAATPA